MRSNDVFLMAMQIVECVYDSALLILLEKKFALECQHACVRWLVMSGSRRVHLF